MVKHRSTGEPDDPAAPDTPEAGTEQAPGDRLKILAQIAAKADERPPSDERLIELLPADRPPQGERVKVPADQFGFAITINDVLYVHVSDAADGTWQFVPFSAK